MAKEQEKKINDYTKGELYQFAKERDIPGRGKMSKDELFEALVLGERGKGKEGPARDADIAAAPAVLEAGSVAGSPVPPAAPPTEIGYVERGAAIPETYGDDKLLAMVRDPWWVFLYWELEGGSCQRIIDECGREFMDSAKWVLRINDLSADLHTDAPVRAEARNWYIHVEPERRYRFELGVVGPGGEFVAVASSEEVETPREGLSVETDEEWMLVRENMEKLMEAMGGVSMGVPGSSFGRRIEFPREVGRSSGAVSSRDSRGGR